MLDSMTAEDELEHKLLQQGGMNSNQAALCIFERKISSGIIRISPRIS